MKKAVLILFLLLTWTVAVHAQGNSDQTAGKKIGLTFSSFGENDVFRSNALIGGPSYNSDHFYSLGLTYARPLSQWLDLETAVEYSNYTFVIQTMILPGMELPSRKESFSLINVPVTVKANFLNFFFINGGLMLDIDTSINSPIDNQTGLGALLGAGLKYNFSFGATAFINPYTKVHSLIPFSDTDHHQRIWESGFRMGILYDLNKIGF